MPRTGRPPTPTEVKRKRGTARADRGVPKNGLAVVTPIADEHELTVEEAMRRVLGAGVSWLASTDGPAVALLRDAVEDYARLRAIDGMPPKEVRDARAQVMALMSQLGFDPTARARLGLAEVTARSKLDEIAARRKASGD